MAAIYNHAGIIGLKIWKFACVAATLGGLATGLAESGAASNTQFNLMVVAALALWPQMQFRPQLFTFALLAAMLAILARDNYRGAARLWIIPPLMILWSNLHAGFVVGIAALAVYASVAGLTDLIAGKGLRRGIRLGPSDRDCDHRDAGNSLRSRKWGAVLHSVGNSTTRLAVTEWQPLWRAMAHQWHQSVAGELSYVLALGLMAGLS